MFGTETKGAPETKNGAPKRTVTPAVDIFERGDDTVLVADLPGVAIEQLKIDVEEEVLTLTTAGEIEYHRAFRLGPDVDAARIGASLKDGVLELTLPKAERAKPRKIEVKPA